MGVAFLAKLRILALVAHAITREAQRLRRQPKRGLRRMKRLFDAFAMARRFFRFALCLGLRCLRSARLASLPRNLQGDDFP
ncbi:MAG: hypothetical protein IPM54_11530 [Polyangiaceae bacterium]|nr:hypothetical protein [Polyangiaceae bacterium]